MDMITIETVEMNNFKGKQATIRNRDPPNKDQLEKLLKGMRMLLQEKGRKVDADRRISIRFGMMPKYRDMNMTVSTQSDFRMSSTSALGLDTQ